MRFTRKASLIAMALAAMTFGTLLLPSAAHAREGWRRLAGADAFGTMTQVVQADDAFTAENVDAVVVATSEGYWDALAASGLAGRLGAPVLITPTQTLAPETRQEIQRLSPSTIYVAGGRAAISDAVAAELAGISDKVVRVSGDSAIETAIALWHQGSGWSKVAVVVSSTGYWDALSMAPYAYYAGAPIFLAGGDGTLGTQTLDAIRQGGFTEVVIAGGSQAVSKSTENQLAGIKVTRLAGKTALDTSAAVASWGLDHGLTTSDLFVATSAGYWDALTGAALAGKLGSALVLVNPIGGTQAYDAMIVAAGGSLPVGTILGGAAAVSQQNYAYCANNGDATAYVRQRLDEYAQQRHQMDNDFDTDPRMRGSMMDLAEHSAEYGARYVNLANDLYAYVLTIPGANDAKLKDEQAVWESELNSTLQKIEDEMAQRPYSGNMYALNRNGERMGRSKERFDELLGYGYTLV